MGRLDNKVVVITGGATGIGEAICHRFAEEGARVVVCGSDEDPVSDVVQAIRDRGGKAIPFAGDFSEESTAEGCIQNTLEIWGRLDVLVNNGGKYSPPTETQDFPLELFDDVIVKNIRATFLMTKYAIPHLQKFGGNIIATGNEAGILGQPENTPYGGTKGWTHAFIKGVASEQAKYGVRANCVCPGPIDTAWTHKEAGEGNGTVSATPMGRRGTLEEVANVYAFLASDMASYVTGALWTVDGGTVIGKVSPSRGDDGYEDEG